VTSYRTPDGISFQMDRTRHGQTRTFGKLPETLDIPRREKGDPTIRETVEEKRTSDERITRFVGLVKNELVEDRDDVRKIYSGKKGQPGVKDTGKVEAGVDKVGQENASKWGQFLSG